MCPTPLSQFGKNTLAAGALCVRYLRAPIADDIGPQLRRLHADVDPQLRRMENQLDTCGVP
jgi:hypothetical protein